MILLSDLKGDLARIAEYEATEPDWVPSRRYPLSVTTTARRVAELLDGYRTSRVAALFDAARLTPAQMEALEDYLLGE